MHINRADKLCRSDASPQAEVDPMFVFSDHPAEEHVEAFAGGSPFGTGEVFTGPFGMLGQGEKIAVKACQGSAGIGVFRSHPVGEG